VTWNFKNPIFALVF